MANTHPNKSEVPVARNRYFGIKTFKQMYFLFFLFSILLTIPVYGLLTHFWSRYEIKLIKKQPKQPNDFIIIHDFEKDGFSESVWAYNPKTNDNSFIHVHNYSGGIIDQFNFEMGTRIIHLKMYDSNEDGYDDIFVFTQNEDSLFLNLIDVHSKEFIFKKIFLLNSRGSIIHRTKNKQIFATKFIQNSSTGTKELLFISIDGNAYKPRGVYKFNLDTRKISKKFEAAAFFQCLLLFDLTGDGINEIILSSGAVGNIHYPAPYKDDRCWLFILDQNLEPLFKPLAFGEYSSRLFVYPVEQGNEKSLTLMYNYMGSKNLPDFLYQIDSHGVITQSKPFHQRNMIYSCLLDVPNKQPGFWYANMEENKVFRINRQLEMSEVKSTPYRNLRLGSFVDLNADGVSELICASDQSLIIYDDNINLLAKFQKNKFPIQRLLIKHNGPESNKDICFTTLDSFYRLSFKKNTIYPFLLPILLCTTGLIFLLFTFAHKIISRLYIYFGFFLYSLQKSAKGILILDHQGRIFYLNSQVQSLVTPSQQIFKHQHFEEALQEIPEIVSLIKKSITQKNSIREKISYIRPTSHFEGEVTVTPIKSPYALIYAYFVEIQDFTQPILSDRLRLWSKSIQKIAHDIKTPLSSINLNLKALQIHLENIPSQEREEVDDDINIIRKELNRVQGMTKNFLKFVNLEKPHLQSVSLPGIIERAIKKFTAYTNGEVRIETEIEREVTEIWADPFQIEILFQIIIENAIDAMHGKGLIKISVILAQNLEMPLRRYIQVEISDSGSGFEDGIKNKLFQPYFTTKQDGTGMGLAIAKKIVEDHGGKIECYSTANLGAVFSLFIPLMQEEVNGT